MDTFVQLIALTGIVVVAVLFVAEIVKWRSIGTIISRKQRILRVILIVLIETLFAMMLLGPMVTRKGNPIAALVYWFVCAMLCLAVVVLAMVDLREVLRGYVALNRRMFGDLSGRPEDEDRRDR